MIFHHRLNCQFFLFFLTNCLTYKMSESREKCPSQQSTTQRYSVYWGMSLLVKWLGQLHWQVVRQNLSCKFQSIFRNFNNLGLSFFTLHSLKCIFHSISSGGLQTAHSAFGSRRSNRSPSGSWPPPSHCWWCWWPRTLRCTSLCPAYGPAGSPPGCYRDRHRNRAEREKDKKIFSASTCD